MLEQKLFYLMIVLQILVGSVWLPKKLIAFGENIITNYPKADYPKLYPYYIDEGYIKSRLVVLKLLSFFGLLSGLFIVGYSAWRQFPELLNWDDQSVTMFLYLLQVLPILLLSSMAPQYFKMMRNEGVNAIRRAELRPRNLLTFVHPSVIALAMLLLVGYLALVAIVAQDPFEGFAGFSPNAIGIVLVNAIFAFVVFKNLYGKRHDPYKSMEDRFRENSLTIRLMFVCSIAVSVYLCISLTLSWMALKSWSPVFQALFFVCMLMIVVINAQKTSDVDFTVYR